MKRAAIQISIIVLLCAGVSGQKKSTASQNLSKPYWLNYSLIFFKGCQPIVSPHNITFAEGSCSADPDAGGIFSKAAKVKIYSVTRDKGFTKIRFRDWPEIYELDAEYEILLRSDSEKNFSKSFELIFSERELTDDHGAACPVDLHTKAQVIECMGFPISISKVGDVERYSYRFGFVNFRYLSYESWIVEMKNDKVIGVSGSI